MRLGVVPESLLEWVALRLGRVPTPVADVLFAMMLSRSLMAGVRLGLFAALERGPLTLPELATRVDLDTPALEALAEALGASGYLVRRGDLLALGEAGRWLAPSSPHYLGNLIQFNYDHWDWWSQLEPCLLSRSAVEIHSAPQTEEELRRYVLAMRDLARLALPEILPEIPVPRGASHLLDVGGSHGLHSTALCRRHPEMAATIVDLDPIAEICRPMVAEEGLGERIRYRSADALRDDLGEGYDLALLFQLLHHFSPADAPRLLQRVARSLKPGGTVALLEPAHSSSRSQLAGLLHLHYFLTSRGGVHPRPQMEAWLTDAGFAPPRARSLRSAPGLLLLVARSRM